MAVPVAQRRRHQGVALVEDAACSVASSPVRSPPVHECAATETLCLPLHPGLNDGDARKVAGLGHAS
ncbi:hypothetical protein [Streptomyces roseifaciens]|uniref:hypothetical protein n=1 Tax=Streptomyces roseifaciens TaxID=1488406 RepID=UPI000B2C4D00|nr:hypothetical protein [Streptomyces roseifaciens]